MSEIKPITLAQEIFNRITRTGPYRRSPVPLEPVDEIAEWIESALDWARREERERCAKMVERRGKEIGGAIDPVRTADSIRALDEDEGER